MSRKTSSSSVGRRGQRSISSKRSSMRSTRWEDIEQEMVSEQGVEVVKGSRVEHGRTRSRKTTEG
jgi:hypothetical protein